MTTSDIRVIRGNALRIIQEAAKIKDREMRRDIGSEAAVIVHLCNCVITASGEPDPLRRYLEGEGLFLRWHDDDPGEGA
jgi:hypothetical protein